MRERKNILFLTKERSNELKVVMSIKVEKRFKAKTNLIVT